MLTRLWKFGNIASIMIGGILLIPGTAWVGLSTKLWQQQLGMGKDLSSGLIKISVENLGNMCPDSWYSAYHFSHPPVVERIAAIADADKRDAKKGK